MIEEKEGTLEELAENLIQKLRNRKDFFTTAKVLVPSNRLADWFKAYYLSTRSTVLMNVSFSLLDEGLLALLPHRPYIRFAREKDVRNLLLCLLSDPEILSHLGKEIRSYLNPDSPSYAAHLYDLSDALASLYFQYDRTGFEPEGEQSYLFERVGEALEERRLGTLRSIGTKVSEGEDGEAVYVFGAARIFPKEEEIIRKYGEKNSVFFYKVACSDTPQFFYSASASRTTEVQILHSAVCRLCEQGASYKDFLVIAPDISEYELEIRRVFHQDGKEYPDIPYVLSGAPSSESEVYNALNLFRSVLLKGFCGRLDFASLLENKVVARARDISPDDADVLLQSLLGMNVYRNADYCDDWLYAFKRVVLSKFLDLNQKGDCLIELCGTEYEPYQNLSLDDTRIVKLCSLIEDLEALMKYKDVSYLRKEEVPAFLEILGRFLSLEDDFGNEQNHLYQSLVKEANDLCALPFGEKGIPFEAFYNSLMSVAKVSSPSGGELFTSGVSFLSYSEEAVLQDKYVFFLGGSSKEFPKETAVSELDQRGEEMIPVPDYSYFRLQAFCGAKEFHYSYVRKDPSTDEDFYPSSFYLRLNEEREKEEGNKIRPVLYDLDEKRPYKELFTRKEFKDKDYFASLLSGGKEKTSPSTEFTAKPEPALTVSLTRMKDFLSEPLMYKARMLFGRGDDTDEKLRDEYEPLDYDLLAESAVFSNVLSTLFLEKTGSLPPEEEKAIWKGYVRNHEIPLVNETFSFKRFDEIVKRAEKTKEIIGQNSPLPFEVVRLPDTVLDFKDRKVLLTCPYSFLRSEDGDNLTYFPMKELKSGTAGLSDYLTVYLEALADVAGRKENEDTEYQIALYIGKGEKYCRVFSITPAKAKFYLSSIYERMNDYSSNRSVPADYVEKENSIPDDPFGLEQKLKDPNGGAWRYFADKNLFRPENLGYGEADFGREIRRELANLGELLGPLVKEKTEKQDHE